MLITVVYTDLNQAAFRGNVQYCIVNSDCDCERVLFKRYILLRINKLEGLGDKRFQINLGADRQLFSVDLLLYWTNICCNYSHVTSQGKRC